MNRGATDTCPTLPTMATTASSLPQLGEVAGALMEKGSRANEILDVIECKLFGGCESKEEKTNKSGSAPCMQFFLHMANHAADMLLERLNTLNERL